MRIWEKVYLVVLVLFVLVLNLCGGFIFRTIYAGSVAASENASATVWRTIAVSMAEDLSGLKDDKALFQTYVSYYNNRNRAFELWRDDVLCYKSVSGTQVIYSSGEGKLQSDYPFPVEDRKAAEEENPDVQCMSRIVEKQGEKYVCTFGKLSGTPYTLVLYEQDTGELSAWHRYMIVFLTAELFASVLMALLLYGVMRKFLSPISRISRAAARVAAGDYSPLPAISGRDELAELAGDIDRMTGQVRRHMEDKEKESLRKQEFIDALSHELRTPLTSIRGYAQLVETARLPEEKKIEYMDYIVRESGRLEEMMKLLRQITLLNQEQVEWKEVPPARILHEIEATLSAQPEFSGIQIQMEAGEGIIRCNPVLAEMFFMNIIRNACQACAGRENGTVEVELWESHGIVSDNGAGMSEECKQRIFEPYYREDASRSRKRGGTGLGMYLCSRIAQVHGWRIEIESEPDRGTTVFVRF